MFVSACTYSATCGHQQGKWPRRAPFGAGRYVGPSGSDRIRYIDEDVAHAEPVREQVAETAHAEGLGGVVAGGEEVHPGLPRAGHRPRDRLAGDERVEAGGDRVLEVVGAGAGDDADGPHAVGAVGEGERLPGQAGGAGGEGERLAGRGGADARDEVVGRDAVAGQAPEDADRRAPVAAERLARPAAQPLGGEGAVAPRARGGRRGGGG